MQIDFNAPLKNLEGDVLMDVNIDRNGNKTEVPATLGRISANALLAMTEDEKNMAGEEKVKRYDLAMRIIKGTADLKVEEVADIKKAVGKSFMPLIVGQAWKLLDPGG